MIMSPASIQTALTLAMFGTDGNTKTQILQGLKFPTDLNDKSIANKYKLFNERVKQSNGLNIANKIYIKRGYSIQQSFQEVAINSFHSQAQVMDFSDSEHCSQTINKWVEIQTNNTITDLIAEDSIEQNTAMIIINAIYFKGTWLYRFKPQHTRQMNFYLNEDDVVMTDFMTCQEEFRFGYNDDLDAQILELPYSDSDIVMLIILPSSKIGLTDLQYELSEVDLHKLTRKLDVQEVVVRIPKFKIEFDIELTEILKSVSKIRL
jgi:serpin B